MAPPSGNFLNATPALSTTTVFDEPLRGQLPKTSPALRN
jgi:hypothetical protein